MKKEPIAVLQGLILTIVISGILTTILALFLHFFPNTWSTIKTLATFLNYSFAIYVGMISASLRTKAMGINPPLYVMLSFFFITLVLRLLTSSEILRIGYVIIKFIYSAILLVVAYKHAQLLQGKKSSTRGYSRLR